VQVNTSTSALARNITPINIFFQSILYGQGDSRGKVNILGCLTTSLMMCTAHPVLFWSRRMRWSKNIARVRERRGVYGVSVGNPERKKPLGRPRCRWVDHIKVELQEVGFEGMECTELAQDADRWQAIVKRLMKFRVP
jgi:hypothetical protein